MQTMKVKILQTTIGYGNCYRAGKTYEIDSEFANNLIETNFAEKAKDTHENKSLTNSDYRNKSEKRRIK